jgi:hypothetical protein
LTLVLNLADEPFTADVNGEVLEASSPMAETAVPPHAWAILAAAGPGEGPSRGQQITEHAGVDPAR